MPFSLKNAGATYQQLVNKIFVELLGVTVEVYIDDMLVKSISSVDHATGLDRTFIVLRSAQMMLNPVKCTLEVGLGKFLGFMVSHRGIEVNPKKVHVILNM